MARGVVTKVGIKAFTSGTVEPTKLPPLNLTPYTKGGLPPNTTLEMVKPKQTLYETPNFNPMLDGTKVLNNSASTGIISSGSGTAIKSVKVSTPLKKAVDFVQADEGIKKSKYIKYGVYAVGASIGIYLLSLLFKGSSKSKLI